MNIVRLKEYIYDNNFIETILENIQCHNIRYHSSGYWSCANKDGDNPTAIIIQNNEYLSCVNYTRKMTNKNISTDIIDLVCYNNAMTFPEAIKYICFILGIDYYYNFDEDIPESLIITNLLSKMKSGNYENNDIPLKPISKHILTYYKPYVNDLFYDDYISYQTQKDFEIGYDENTNRITIPIFSEIGDLVGVKGRIFKKELSADDIKYIYLEPCSKSKILYGMYKTLPYIKKRNCVYVVESEKGVMQLWTYGYQNVVATGGKNISLSQIEMLTRLGVDIILCFDKDVNEKEIYNYADKFIDNIPIYYIKDNNNILKEKESPTDNPKKWIKLVDSNIYRIR